MKHVALFCMAALLMPGAAGAQAAGSSPRIETVTVTAPKPDLGAVIQKYVQGLAAPSPFLDRIARWRDGVCPTAMGLTPDAAALVESRIKAVAKTVGAPVAANASCRANVEIVVTPQPQALLDALRQKNPGIFGFSSGPAQTARQAVMSWPVQGWYVTATRDYDGILHPDEMYDDCVTQTGHRDDCYTLVSGFRLNDGLQSEFVNALIIVDSGKAAGMTIASLADYAAIEALAQTQAAQTCRALPTVTNLMMTGCPGKADALTDTDIAYLRALYRIRPDAPLTSQEHQISHDMEKNLSGTAPPAR